MDVKLKEWNFFMNEGEDKIQDTDSIPDFMNEKLFLKCKKLSKNIAELS